MIKSNSVYYKKDIKRAVKELMDRICYPNKPLNTFAYAREIKEIIIDIFGKELTTDKHKRLGK